MKKNFLIFIFLFCLLSCFQALGQSSDGVPPAMRYRLSAKHFTGKGGLTANTVWSMMEDQQGFMWFTVNNGLNRYDGKRFKFYDKTALH